MDEQKDIQRTDAISRFVEQPVRTNPFGENRAAERAYRRAERIAAAVHMLTNHINSGEAVRSLAREVATSILTDVLKLRDEMRSPYSSSLSDMQGHIRYLISLIRIMAVSGFVSPQNANTVIEGVDELGNFLVASQRSILSENVSFTKEDLIDVRTSSYKSHTGRIIKDMSDTKDNRDAVFIKDTTVRPGETLDALTVRVQSILEILKVGGSLGIKDISANLPEYSEKMIQRELLDMVARGAVKKTGLKRWSKYSVGA